MSHDRSDQSTRVIVGVEESIAGLRALRSAVAVARRRHAKLYAVRAGTFAPPKMGQRAESWQVDIAREAAATVGRAFGAALGGVPPDLDVWIFTAPGPAGPALVRCVESEDDLIIVGTSQRAWTHRLARRSVARYCLVHAACPVLVVPPHSLAKAARPAALTRAVWREARRLVEVAAPE